MLNESLIPRVPYEGCRSSYSDADLVLIGAGYDGTSSYRPGSRFAPQAVRAETLYSQEDYSPYFDREITEKAIHDAGDLDLPIGNKTGVLEMIREAARELFADRKRPCFIGGEHLITLPVIEAALEKYQGLHLLQLDAHLDLIDELFGDRLSHGTVMRRCLEMLQKGDCLHQVGIRSGSREEWQFARQHTRLFPFDTKAFLENAAQLQGFPVYLTLDLDIFDPAQFPGTGTPEAGGIFFPEFIAFLKGIAGLNIVGCDVVELSPKIDPTGNSTAFAAKVLRELLIAI